MKKQKQKSWKRNKPRSSNLENVADEKCKVVEEKGSFGEMVALFELMKIKKKKQVGERESL